MRYLISLLVFLFGASTAFGGLPESAVEAAEYAVEHHDRDQVEVLSDLVRFRTVHREGVENAENPEFRAFADSVRQRADEYGLDFTDLGAVLVVGLGDADQRLGIVTHGDVQPADADKWARSPFELDAETEPGKLIARGTEDNKAPIATALQAMRSIRELDLDLERRIELIISLTEESDWDPFLEVLERWDPPQMNIAIDSEYPVVVAEKGWGGVWLEFAGADSGTTEGPAVERFEGGSFISQVPGEAQLVVQGVDDALAERVRRRAGADDSGAEYEMTLDGDVLSIQVRGRTAHSMHPQKGINALTQAAALLAGESLADTAASRALDFVNALIGTGIHGERLGEAAYEHDFMGPLTVNLSTAERTDDGVSLAVNTRAPAGKSAKQLENDIRQAVADWSDERGWPNPIQGMELSDAHYPQRAPQVDALLSVYRHFTGDRDAQPISIGGATNARLLPNGVNFGPSMPGQTYSGHSEHEFISREQMTLNLRMYTAMMTMLAMQPAE